MSKLSKMKNTHKKWFKSVSALLMVAICLVTPAGSMMAQSTPDAANLTPGNYLPFVRNNVCSGRRPPEANKIGVQIYGVTGYKQAHFNLLQNMHSNWVRNTVFWPSVEPTNRPPSEYKWGIADGSLLTARDNCTNVIATIDYTTPWATQGLPTHLQAPIKTDNLPDYVEFVTAMVERYDGDGIDDTPAGIVVNYWEFYNEPDGGFSPTGGGGWGNFGARYAQMLQAVYPAVKKANKNAVVVFGGIAYDRFVGEPNGGAFVRDFFKNVLDAGGGDYFDIMNLHYYPFSSHRRRWTESDSSGLVEKIENIKSIMADHDVSKPIMVTEAAWHSNDTAGVPSNFEYQSRHVVQLLTQAVAEDVVAVTWWAFYDPGAYQFKSGLVEGTTAPKPAYNVYIEAIKRIGSASPVKVVVAATATNDLEVYESVEPGTNKKQFIAWLNPIAPFNAEAEKTFDDTTTETWQAPASRATVYNKEGTKIATIEDAADGSHDGVVTVTVGRSPIYIVVE